MRAVSLPTSDLQMSIGLPAAPKPQRQHFPDTSGCCSVRQLSAYVVACRPERMHFPIPWIAAQCGSRLPTLWLADMQLPGMCLPAHVATSAKASFSACQQLTLPPDLV